MALDAQLPHISADYSEGRDLWHARERCPKMARKDRLVFWIQVAIPDELGQEIGLITIRCRPRSGSTRTCIVVPTGTET